jgi:UDP-3-O-[3-hydroxymyristoyl] N-acetylglucosamine deacetylase
LKVYQRTISKNVSVTGVGLHSGKKITLSLRPLPADSGVCFKRSDLLNSKSLKADALTVGVTENNTSIGTGLEAIQTVEHLLSVLYALGIDNVLCEVDGPEVPIMDGSGASFLYLLRQAGVQKLSKEKNILVIKEKVQVKHLDKWASIEPHDGFLIESSISFNHPIIGDQRFSFDFNSSSFIEQIVRARTFGLLRDVDSLRDKGLVKGGSLKNAIVLDDFKVLNSEGLRFKDEFIRHKVLDTVGDLSLLGFPIAGKVESHKAGHYLNNLLCRKVLESKENYEIVKVSDLANIPENIFDIEGFALPSLA